jgi:hypothetical protein
MSLDPTQDGWQTEHLNAIAGKQLKRLGRAFEGGQPIEAADLLSILANDFKSTKLVPTSTSTPYDSFGVTIEQSHTPVTDFAIQTADGLASHWNTIFRVFPEKHRHAKFKIIRVVPSDNSFETVQLVSMNGRDDQVAMEHNSTWRVQWSQPPDSGAPRIQSISVERFEQSRVVGTGSIFHDATSDILKHDPDIAVDQFGVGVDQWVRRLEYYQLAFQFGHNGVSVGDVNGDGWEDIYRCQLGGLPNRLFITQSDGTVRDQAAEYGVDLLDNTRSALFVDLDNDGDQDLTLALAFEVLFYENVGQKKFELRHKLRMSHTYSLNAADFDLDGDLDIYASVYFAERDKSSELPIPMPVDNASNGGKNALLRNDGEWVFSNATVESGLDENNSRFSFAAVWEDYDNDGQLDLFVANDFGRNNLYRNDGGKFRDVTKEIGAVDDTFGMSAATSDVNRDGWIDFYKANMYSSAGNRVATQPAFLPGADSLKDKMLHLARGNTLLINREGRFTDESVARGVAMGRWSWGSIFLDFNNDGWEDLFVANGFITGPKQDDL